MSGDGESAARFSPGVAAALAGLVVLLWLGARGVGPLPALGPLLDPWAGVWSTARQARPPRERTAVIPTLDAPVEVRIDDRGVPHVYATTMLDTMRALGYLVATDRLFQLEIQTRATAGTLTELIGERALPLDREQRALGLAWAAERSLAALPESSLDYQLYKALADGINARIDTLSRTELPFEYHFLGRRPQRWSVLHSLLLAQRMAYTLSYSADDLWRLRVEGLVGRAAADALYPINSPIQEPIQPAGSDASRDAVMAPLPPPALTDLGKVRRADALLAAVPAAPAVPAGVTLGSNNWAISAARSTTGNAVLAGDPHLALTLPSIWYEVHLVAEQEGFNVHGVTIPGLPGAVIAFTPAVAWTVTNNSADVVDFYRETLDDPRQPARYLLDGEWEELTRREEVYLAADGRELARDTQFFTHRGPLYLTDGAGAVSMRWLAHEAAGAPTRAFVDAARASSVDDVLAAFENFAVPAQNFLIADADGRIAIRSTGRYPIRPPDDREMAGAVTDGAAPAAARAAARAGGDGRRLRDGSTRASDWRGFWPLEMYPQARDPGQGYLASANQQPVDPALEPAYLGSNWTSPWRALRINALLRGQERFSAHELGEFQTDPGNAKAERFLPWFLRAAEAQDDLAQAHALLAAWDTRYTPDAAAPLLFEEAFRKLRELVWDELDPQQLPLQDLPRPPWPKEAVLYQLLAQGESAWWDRVATRERERRDDILRIALGEAWTGLTEKSGRPEDGAWAWRDHRFATVNHLARFPGLGREGLTLVGGGPGNLNPSSGNGNHGASWRMVVEMDPEAGPRATVAYPGGQSGNPASPRYDDRLAAWQAGKRQAVVSPPDPAAFDAAFGDRGWRIELLPGRSAAAAGER